MSDEINDKIKQIAEILGHDHIPDGIKDMVELLIKSSNKNVQNTSGPSTDTSPKIKNMTNNHDFNNKVRRIANAINAGNDDRMNLLLAVKPFLNQTRQKRIGDCMKILQLTKLASILNNDNE